MARAKKKSEKVAEEVAELNVTEAADVAEAAEEVGAGVESVEEKPELIMTLDDVRLVEAMLFASASALDERTIAERFPEDRASLIPDILEHLKEHYAGRGVTLVQRDRKWALRTATDLGDQLRLEKEQPKKFTRAAMETMAVVAYHQPVTRAEIENIRGVATSPGALDALMEAGWIKPGKRREVPGRPVTWLSTQAFLDHFGLERLADLPGMDELKAAGLLDKRPAIEAMPNPADLFDGAAANDEGGDPQEVTDEDLLGGTDDDTVMESDDADEDGYEGDDTDDTDDEDFDHEDGGDESDDETDSDDDDDYDDDGEDDDDFDDEDDEDDEDEE